MYVCMYVCMCVAIRHPRVHHALCTCARISQFGKNVAHPAGELNSSMSVVLL